MSPQDVTALAAVVSGARLVGLLGPDWRRHADDLAGQPWIQKAEHGGRRMQVVTNKTGLVWTVDSRPLRNGRVPWPAVRQMVCQIPAELAAALEQTQRWSGPGRGEAEDAATAACWTALRERAADQLDLLEMFAA